MFGLSVVATTLLLAASRVQAHATFQYLGINGVDQGTKCTRIPATNSPIENVGLTEMSCNRNGNIPAASTCAVNAGDSMYVEMHEQPGVTGCGSIALGGAHLGPTIVYMAKVDDTATATPETASWFKVNQTGLIQNSPQIWGVDDMNRNCGKVFFKIPTDIAAGNYLIRAEVIALHTAGGLNGAQFYMSCYQVKVSGSGTANPIAVKFPGAYKNTDAGILVSIYGNLNGYTVPGPPMYISGGSSTPVSSTNAPAVSSSTVRPVTSSTTARPATSTTVRTSSTAAPVPTSGATAAQYQQCGGTGFTGPSTCASPFKCVVLNPYYSQCQ